MNKLLPAISRLAFYAGWPGIYLILRLSRRTRVMVIVGNELLVVKPWLGDGRWQLPGGGIKWQEPVRVAAARELQEELGLSIKPDQLKLVSEMFVKETGLRYQASNFSVVLPKKPPLSRQRHEIAAAEWLPIDKLPINTCQASLLTVVKTWLKQQNLV